MKKTITIHSRGEAQRLLASGEVKSMAGILGPVVFDAEKGAVFRDGGHHAMMDGPWTYSIEVPAEAPKSPEGFAFSDVPGVVDPDGHALSWSLKKGFSCWFAHIDLPSTARWLVPAHLSQMETLGGAECCITKDGKVFVWPGGTDIEALRRMVNGWEQKSQHDMREKGTYTPTLGDVSTWKGLINTPPETHEQVLRYGGSDVSFGGHDLNKAVFNNVNFSIRGDGKVLVAPKPMRAVSDEEIEANRPKEKNSSYNDGFADGARWREELARKAGV